MPQELPSKPKLNCSKNLRVGVFSGGTSSERKISLRSGRAVYQALKRSGYSVIFLDPKNISKMEDRLSRIDVAFIALHGRGGEDGAIQKFLQNRGVPYIGSDARASWKAFDKGVAKRIFRKAGILTPPGILVNAKNWEKRLSKFPIPFFIKPSCEGSSIGAFAVEDFEKAKKKIKKEIESFGELIVEKKIEGREFTVGILGDTALPVVEMKPKNAFYDYRAKYTKGMTDYQVPAAIPQSLSRKMQAAAIKAHQSLGMRDFSRIDMMMDKDLKPYVLEANSIPGFTELSLLPKAARAAGISFEDLCSRLVSLACSRKKKLLRKNKEKWHGKKKA